MSSSPPASSPRSVHCRSRAPRSESGTSEGEEILTPGKKIRALLAEFDDSDSDSAATNKKSRNRGVDRDSYSEGNSNSDLQDKDTGIRGSKEEEDHDNIAVPRRPDRARRLVTAMMQDDDDDDDGDEHGVSEMAWERLSRQIREARMEKEKENGDENQQAKQAGQSDNNDLPSSNLHADSPASSTRSDSPLFVALDDEGLQSHTNNADDSETNECPQANVKGNPRFLALVARKRQERERQEKEEAAKRAARVQQQMKEFSSEVAGVNSEDDGEVEEEDDDELARKPKAKRPSRKASKKALEEMNRETQRISRNMQLTHQATTKKKITKESFLARFNNSFLQQQKPDAAEPSTGSQPSHSSDDEDEAHKDKDTPRTSPIPDTMDKSAPVQEARDQSPTPSTSSSAAPSNSALSPSKRFDWAAIEAEAVSVFGDSDEPQEAQQEPAAQQSQQPTSKPKKKRTKLTKPPVRVRLPRQVVAQHQIDDSDSDLEVVTSPAKERRIAAFENLPSKRRQEPSYILKLKALAHLTSPSRQATSPADLSSKLLHRARQQAEKEKQERIQELRDRGIHVETAEERAAMEDQVEDLVEKARKEADEIGREERKGSKKDAKHDNDFELSGSDEEYDGEDDSEDDGSGNEKRNMVDDQAGEDDESEDEALQSDQEDPTTPVSVSTPGTVQKLVDSPKTPRRSNSQASASASPSQQNLPDLGGDFGSFNLGLTQAFHGTFSDNREETGVPGSSAMFHSPPNPVASSQGSLQQTPGSSSSYSSLAHTPEPSGYHAESQIPDPTPFKPTFFPESQRFKANTPASTIDTVLASQRTKSPVPTARGEDGATAFDVMKKASKKRSGTQFDRNKSRAKDVVDEAAEESEDEYAGLGGDSDEGEDSGDEYDQQIIDDNSGETVDKKQLAALNAYVWKK